MVNLVLLVVAVTFGVFRFTMPSHPLSLPGTYEAFAHLFLGGLIGAWLISKDRFYLLLILALSVVETVAFFTK
jgi:hypothetical protein